MRDSYSERRYLVVNDAFQEYTNVVLRHQNRQPKSIASQQPLATANVLFVQPRRAAARIRLSRKVQISKQFPLHRTISNDDKSERDDSMKIGSADSKKDVKPIEADSPKSLLDSLNNIAAKQNQILLESSATQPMKEKDIETRTGAASGIDDSPNVTQNSSALPLASEETMNENEEILKAVKLKDLLPEASDDSGNVYVCCGTNMECTVQSADGISKERLNKCVAVTSKDALGDAMQRCKIMCRPKQPCYASSKCEVTSEVEAVRKGWICFDKREDCLDAYGKSVSTKSRTQGNVTFCSRTPQRRFCAFDYPDAISIPLTHYKEPDTL